MLGELLDHRDDPSTHGRMPAPTFETTAPSPCRRSRSNGTTRTLRGVGEERREPWIRVGIDRAQELARAFLPGPRHRCVDADREVRRDSRPPSMRGARGRRRGTRGPRLARIRTSSPSSSRSTFGMSAASGSVSTRATIAERRARSCFCLRSWRSLAAENHAVPRANTHSPAMVRVAPCASVASVPTPIHASRTPARAPSRRRRNSSVCHRASFNPVR